MADDRGTEAREYHALTRHGSPVDRSRLVAFRPLDPANRPAPFTRFPDRDPRPLPSELADTTTRAVDVLSGRAGPPWALDARTLSTLLFLTAGVVRVSSASAFTDRTYFRPAMSAGNLHPVEVYVACGDLDGGVDAGLHHYAPLTHGLTPLRRDDVRTRLARDAHAVIVLTGIPWRTAWKYGERGYRHLFWDAGTLLANLLAVAAAHGIATEVHVAFDDDQVADTLGVDGTAELPLAVVALCVPGAPPPPGRTPDALPRLGLAREPVAPHPIELPLVTETHRAGALGDVEGWRSRAATLGTPSRHEIEPPHSAPDLTIHDVILQRGSTRIFERSAVPRDLLDWGLGAAMRPVTSDFAAPGATLLEHDVSVHAVDGVAPGAYRWRGGRREDAPVRAGDHRAEAELLCLRQPLGGDAAYTVFHCADLGTILPTLGTRGYRAAQLEAGVAAGRLSLAAFALGYGATGLTFYDDAVSHFFATPASCMLVTAVGVPAYRNTAGGRPGDAVELAGYGRLMERLSMQLHRSDR